MHTRFLFVVPLKYLENMLCRDSKRVGSLNVISVHGNGQGNNKT